MKQTLCTIRTRNFATMRDFYRNRMRLRHHDPVGDDFIWFRDFGTEIHMEAVTSDADVGVSGVLRLIGSDVLGISKMFKERGVPVQVRERGSATESFITDPDDNIIMLVSAAGASA
jgi:hypothetical protein